LNGDRKLICEITVRDGQVVWDLNGLAGEDWTKQKRERTQGRH